MKKVAFAIAMMTALWVFGKFYADKEPLVFSTAVAEQASSVQKELDQLDKEIEVLRNRRNMYLARAYNNDLNAERWQFQDERFLDAKQAWENAEADRAEARKLQEQIDALEKKREKFLVDHAKR